MNEKQKKLAEILEHIFTNMDFIDLSDGEAAEIIATKLTERNDLDIKFLETE